MITKRKDGTFIVDHNGSPYHVVPKEVDPYNAFDFAEIQAYAEAHPDEVVLEGVIDLDELKIRSKSKFNEAWVSARRKTTDFTYKGSNWQCDEQAQANLNSYIALVQLGLPGPFEWRNRDNVMHQLTGAELVELAGAMLSCIQGIYRQAWTAKEAIRNATDAEEVESIVAQYGG